MQCVECCNEFLPDELVYSNKEGNCICQECSIKEAAYLLKRLNKDGLLEVIDNNMPEEEILKVIKKSQATMTHYFNGYLSDNESGKAKDTEQYQEELYELEEAIKAEQRCKYYSEVS